MKTAKKMPKNTVSSTVAVNSIPADLIVNCDQTGVRIVPVTDWTMTTRGSKQVSVTDVGVTRDVFQQEMSIWKLVYI